MCIDYTVCFVVWYCYFLLSSIVLPKNRMYVTFCCLHGKTIRAKCNLKVAISLNSWIYNKKVIIQLTVQYRNTYQLVQYSSHLGTCPNIFRYCTVNCIITYKYWEKGNTFYTINIIVKYQSNNNLQQLNKIFYFI